MILTEQTRRRKNTLKNKMKALSILASMIMITLLLCAMVSCNNGGGEVESCKHDDPSKIEIVPGVDPTCTDTGLTEGMKCTECDTMVVPQVISQALGHTEVIDKAVEPTCTKTGLTGGKHCLVCGVVIISQNTIPTVECVAGNWIIEKEATKSENGSQYKKCVFCGSRLEEEIIPFIGSTGLEYEVNSDGETCTITGIGNCKDTDVLVPCYINGYKVRYIGDSAFDQCHSLTSIVIPDSVISIGDDAFEDCTSLTNVVIGNGVTSIGDYAFYHCTSLTGIVIGNSVTSIGDDAFYYCTSLTSRVIPDSVISIGDDAFYHCDSLTSIVIGDGVTIIDVGAFYNCKSLTSIVIPDSVISIGDYAFSWCTSLTSIVIPDSVTSIGEGAFYNCSSLTSVVIGDSVTSIGNWAFSHCDSLEYNEYDNGKYLGNADNPYLYLAYVDNKDITNYNIHPDTKLIGYEAFYNCKSLTSIVIPDSVTSIGEGAFYNCSSLTSVVIGDSVTSIGESAFYYCTSLTSIEVDADNQYYKSIDGNLYSKNGKTLIQYAIGKTDTSFKVPSGVTSIGNHAFYSCDSLTNIVIPDSVTSIGDEAFEYCTSLTSIVIPDSVTSIGEGAFSWCSSLTIYCEAKSKPTGWNNNWNYSNRPVVWGYTVK